MGKNYITQVKQREDLCCFQTLLMNVKYKDVTYIKICFLNKLFRGEDVLLLGSILNVNVLLSSLTLSTACLSNSRLSDNTTLAFECPSSSIYLYLSTTLIINLN